MSLSRCRIHFSTGPPFPVVVFFIRTLHKFAVFGKAQMLSSACLDPPCLEVELASAELSLVFICSLFSSES